LVSATSLAALLALLSGVACAAATSWLDERDDLLVIAALPVLPSGFVIRGLPHVGLFQLQPIFSTPVTGRIASYERGAATCSAQSPRNALDGSGIQLSSIALPSLSLPPLCPGVQGAKWTPGTACPRESFEVEAQSCWQSGDTFVARSQQGMWLGDPISVVLNTLALVPVRTTTPPTGKDPFRWK